MNPNNYSSSHKLCLAPMLDWTDTHFRYFIRLLSPHCVLYTEMITTGALLRGDAHRFLSYSSEEHPLALQVGGSDPEALAQCARLAKEYGYDEINLNVGCPSDRVQKGRFGACLMKEPNLVAECIAAMNESMTTSVKCRIGVDDQEDYDTLENFVGLMQASGSHHVIVHARKAWLSGLSPKENREIPPLNYPWVYQLKKSFPTFPIIINGAIKTVEEAQSHLKYVDGVMIGRPAYENPYFFRELENVLFSEIIESPLSIVKKYLPYVEKQLNAGIRLSPLVRPIMGIFNGLPGSRHWRRYLSEHCHAPNAGIQVITDAFNEFEVFASI
ncbi:MAG: tRNA dihydrouridine(20/20a) synthase DusA [Pseudomonadota bacterium]